MEQDGWQAGCTKTSYRGDTGELIIMYCGNSIMR
jgi:hypothetical protein